MTDDDSAATAQSVYDAWNAQLRLVHITVCDEDGDGYPAPDVNRWAIDVRVPVHADEHDAVSIGRVIAFTVLEPEGLMDMAEAFEMAGLLGDYKSAVAVHHPSGGSFPDLFDEAADLLSTYDLLVIDQVTIAPEYRDLPGLLDALIPALQAGPAGRTSAFTVLDPTVWNVPFTDGTQESLSFAQWADTTMYASMNADPEEAAMAALARASADTGQLDGARADDLWLGDMLDAALEQPSIPVPFTLPPALPANLWAGAPEDIRGVNADPDSGSITVELHTGTYEVVGMPGNAPQLVGDATEAVPQTREWLRAVHQRWWQYQPELHDQIHRTIDAYLDASLPTVSEDEPHLHIPNVSRPIAPWPIDGTIHLEPLADGDTDPRVFDVHHDTVDGGHEHIGAVIVHSSGHIRAFLHDEWRPDLTNHEQVVAALIAEGAAQFISDALHDILGSQVTGVILTGDIDGH